eukprot:12067146-Alexandrium_andersonii.AAC.1
MSASLVGSEMCIRDSLEALRAEGSRGVRISMGAQWFRRLPHPNSSEPVSYTHLTLPTICSV